VPFSAAKRNCPIGIEREAPLLILKQVFPSAPRIQPLLYQLKLDNVAAIGMLVSDFL